jgi:hypothetical protein
MELQNVIHSFQRLCDMPVAWALLALFGARALWSIVVFVRCPYVNHAPQIDVIWAREAVNSPNIRSPRFLVTMLAGMALAIGGLYGLQSTDLGPMALAALLIGMFVLIVEPSHLSVMENTRRVAAARLSSGDDHDFALERLRAAHFERLATEVSLAILLGALLLLN